MVFQNLFKPPHHKRLLLALAAASAAIVIYFTAEHFQVIPGTAALDEEAPRLPALGDLSVAVLPVTGECPDEIPPLLTLEAIRHLVRVPDLEIMAPQSALALSEIRHRPESPGKSPTAAADTAWILRVSCATESDDIRISASLLKTGSHEIQWMIEKPYSTASLQEFISELTAGLLAYLEIEVPEWPSEEVEPAAYLNYLRARLLLQGPAPDAVRAQVLLEETHTAEPKWAAALSALAYSRLLQMDAEPGNAANRLVAANDDLERAIELQPEDPASHLYRSMIAHRFDWDWAKAYEEAQAALRSAPGDATVLAMASTAAFTLGEFEQGAQWLQKAIPLDPLVLSHRLKYGLMLEFNGQPRAAIEAYRELKVLDPFYPGVHAYLGRALIVGDRIKLALPHMEIERNAFWREYGVVLALYALGRDEEADQKFEKFTAQHAHEAAAQVAEIKAYMGARDEAFDWLQRAIEQRDPGVAGLVGNPLLNNLVNDPRWDRLLIELGLTARDD